MKRKNSLGRLVPEDMRKLLEEQEFDKFVLGFILALLAAGFFACHFFMLGY